MSQSHRSEYTGQLVDLSLPDPEGWITFDGALVQITKTNISEKQNKMQHWSVTIVTTKHTPKMVLTQTTKIKKREWIGWIEIDLFLLKNSSEILG